MLKFLTTNEWLSHLLEVQKDWSQFRKEMYHRREPTPCFNDKDLERRFYDEIERKLIYGEGEQDE